MLILISSCQTNGPADPVVVDTACNWVVPIYLTKNDINVLDPQTKRAILAHDEKWEVNCASANGREGQVPTSVQSK